MGVIIKPTVSFVFLPVVVSAYYGLVALEFKGYFFVLLKAFFAYSSLFLMGYTAVMVSIESNNANHYIHSLSNINYYEVVVVDFSSEGEKVVKLEADVQKIKIKNEWSYASGKVLLCFDKKDSQSFQVGEKILVKSNLSSPNQLVNPEAFNYKAYLFRQGIYSTQYCKRQEYVKSGFQKRYWWLVLSDTFRLYCLNQLKIGIKNNNEYQLASALLLGVSAEMNQALYQAYADTGTVHALAVSGMHVTLVYAILIGLFGFVKQVKYGNYLFFVMVLLVLWFYALVTGFSPSIVRAVTMFTILLVAAVVKKNTNVYNNIAVSICVILAVNPFWIADIGFQFSFLAVLGIVCFCPFVYSLVETKYYVWDKLWSLICISTVAQLAVAPLSIYYFHSFPLLFLFFNLFIVPISSLAMYTGIGGLICSKINFLADFLFKSTDYLLQVMNYMVLIPARWKWLKLELLPMHWLELIMVYLSIVLISIAIAQRSVKFLYLSFITVAIGCMISCSLIVKKYTSKQFTVYAVNNRTVFSFIEGGRAYVYSDSLMSFTDKSFVYAIKNHLIDSRIQSVIFNRLNESSVVCRNLPFGQLIVWNGFRVLRINGNAKEFQLEQLKGSVDVLVLSDGASLDITLIADTRVNVVLDSSFKKRRNSNVNENFYDCIKKGAYTLMW